MSSGSGSSPPASLLGVWSRTSSRALETMIEANRTVAAAFGVAPGSGCDATAAWPPDPSRAGGESEPEPEPEDAVKPAGNLPGWEVTRTAARDNAPSVGDTVRFSKRLTGGDVDRFAAASGDTNPLHLDDEWADGTRFGGRIVHGTLVSGLISAALARLPGNVVYLSQEVSFQAPVRPGDRVTAEVEVVEVLGDDRLRLRTRVFDDGDAVIDGEAVVLVDDEPGE